METTTHPLLIHHRLGNLKGCPKTLPQTSAQRASFEKKQRYTRHQPSRVGAPFDRLRTANSSMFYSKTDQIRSIVMSCRYDIIKWEGILGKHDNAYSFETTISIQGLSKYKNMGHSAIINQPHCLKGGHLLIFPPVCHAFFHYPVPLPQTRCVRLSHHWPDSWTLITACVNAIIKYALECNGLLATHWHA